MRKVICEDCGAENRHNVDHYCRKCSNDLI